MRVQIFSDLHSDVAPTRPIFVSPDVDAVVVAGDTCEGAEHAFAVMRQFVPMQLPIVAVMGNHEYYRSDIESELAQARRQAPMYGVHLLEDDAVELAGVRFVGATLWTDYLLFGEGRRPFALQAAAAGLNDHRKIAWTKRPEWRRFRPQEAVRLHRGSRAFIERTLSAGFDGPTVVVTHHAPHPASLLQNHESDLLSAAYGSDLGELINTGQPALWIHGHVHCSFDYRVGDTRILCNPHGYGRENTAFDPTLVVEVGS